MMDNWSHKALSKLYTSKSVMMTSKYKVFENFSTTFGSDVIRLEFKLKEKHTRITFKSWNE